MSPRSYHLLALFLFGVLPVSARGDDAKLTPEQVKFFETKIRPVLVEHCYECHSVESDEPGGNLLLDTKAGMFKGGLTGPVHIAGDPEKSLLIKALRYDEIEMPPDQPLSEAVVNDFVKWVKQGAFDPRSVKADSASAPTKEYGRESLWSFLPRTTPELPYVENEAWGRDPVDRFVLQKIERNNLIPTQDADPRTLIRRLYSDLIGLAPTFDEVEEFAALHAKNKIEATEQLVDRLLESPQFGVRWGRHWLDVARYGESNGDDGLGRNATFPHAWRYRDYVIDAFNQDVPFDRFVTEQIAGDLLPAQTAEQRNRQLIATGFLAIGSKPAVAMNKNFAMDVVDDQINVVSTAIMGLSVACARCHDHKHDPIPTRDYYSMAGIFTSSQTLYGAAGNQGLTAPPTPLHELVSVWDPSSKSDFKTSPQFPETYSAKIDELQPELHLSFQQKPEILNIEGKTAEFTGKDFAKLKEAAIRGELPEPETEESEADVSKTDYAVSFWFKNNIKNTERPITAYLFSRGKWKESNLAGDHLGIGGKHDSKRTGKLFVFNGKQKKVSIAGSTVISPGTWNHVVLIRRRDQIQLFLNGAAKPEIDAKIPSTIGESREFALATRTDNMFPLDGNLAEFSIYSRALDASEAHSLFAASGQPQRPTTLGLAMGVREKEKPQDCKIHIGGETSKLGEVVPRGFLTAYQQDFVNANHGDFSAASDIPAEASGRLELAKWLTSPDHPQTARVFVNRVWSHLFGHGLVATVDDFGVYGARPSHPELLDYLANRFVAEGWSVKKLIRELVLSRTYQQDSQCVELLAKIDPGNTFFARYSRRRLDAESIRDRMLQASGKLDLTPQAGSAIDQIDTLINWPPGAATNLHQKTDHRSIYLCMLRHSPPPELAAFDLPDGIKVTGRRDETVLPTQTLYLLNNSFVIEQSYALAEYSLNDQNLQDADRVAFLFRRILQRNPTDFEIEQALRLIGSIKKESDPQQKQLTEVWATLCQGLFATNEFRYVD
ncbi:DUF1553 domain-containing protein [Thalassoglobus sp.]|uniref:DUF1553 domain-containing protein n=1 Tax=Thalassoglobus sp. TaxID=2795869 RepID=UPI003AA94CAE